jgi:hypothetical protein
MMKRFQNLQGLKEQEQNSTRQPTASAQDACGVSAPSTAARVRIRSVRRHKISPSHENLDMNRSTTQNCMKSTTKSKETKEREIRKRKNYTQTQTKKLQITSQNLTPLRSIRAFDQVEQDVHQLIADFVIVMVIYAEQQQRHKSLHEEKNFPGSNQFVIFCLNI